MLLTFFKNNNRFFFTSILLVFFFALTAQTEIEIKTSGNYFWGQSIDETEEESRLFARDELMANISSSIGTNFQTDVLVDGIKYLSFPRGPRVRVIAFILKANVKSIQQKTELKVVQMHYTESDTFENENQSIQQDSNKPVNSDSNTLHTQLNPINERDFDNIIDLIISANSITDISEILAREKQNGKIMYGTYSSSTIFIEKCYFIVFDPFTGSIISFLDKGDGYNRKNLKNQKVINNFQDTYKQMNIVWIQIL